MLDYLLQFIEEDAPSGDVTSAAIIPDITCNAVIRAEQEGIIAGLEEASTLFSHFGVSVTHLTKDGDAVCQNDSLLLLNGDAKKILLVERTALNIIGRMSGIATQTRKIIRYRICSQSILPGSSYPQDMSGIPDTRQKGGKDWGRRSSSYELKRRDSYQRQPSGAGSTSLLLSRQQKRYHSYKKIEVEVETPENALFAAKAGADIIMLDNMSPDQITQTIRVLKTKVCGIALLLNFQEASMRVPSHGMLRLMLM